MVFRTCLWDQSISIDSPDPFTSTTKSTCDEVEKGSPEVELTLSEVIGEPTKTLVSFSPF